MFAAFPRDANWPSAVLCVRVVVSSCAEGQPVAMLVPAQRPTVRPQCSQVVQDPCHCTLVVVVVVCRHFYHRSSVFLVVDSPDRPVSSTASSTHESFLCHFVLLIKRK